LRKNILSRPIILLFILPSVIFLTPGLAHADVSQSSLVFQTQRRFIEEEYINKLKKSELPGFLGKEEAVKFETGGLLSSSYEYYQNTDNNSSQKDLLSAVITQDLFVWGKATFSNGNYVYIRGRDTYTIRDTSSLYTGPSPSGNNKPTLDMAYLSMRHKQYSLNLGRQYFIVGKGVAYRDINDGLQLTSYSDKWLYKFLFAHSLPHENNVDYSVPGFDKYGNDRFFWGGEVGYLAKETSKAYLFFLIQKDNSKAKPADPTQNYHYDSQYLGTGFSSLKDNFTFYGEIIKEFGTSHTDSSTSGTSVRKPIDAWGGFLGTRYRFKQPFEPSTDIEIAYGSGDKDRSNVTNTKGGNKSGKDTNFSYFGDYAGGYALSPRLSNLYIYKLDQSLKPFFFTNSFKDITVGLKFYTYLKDKRGGGISDFEATDNHKFVGNEFDFYLYWSITKDLNFVMRYGIFYPGNAYPVNTDTNTKYAYARLTYVF